MKSKILIMVAVLATIPAFVHAQSSLTQQSQPLPIEWSFDRSKEISAAPSDNADVLNLKSQKIEEKKELKSINLLQTIGNKLRKTHNFIGDPNRPDQKIWDVFTSIVGEKSSKKFFQKFVTYDGPHDNVLGFVLIERIDNPGWDFALNVNGLDFSNKKSLRDMIITMIHEYGHILTLNTNQVDYLINTKHGCSKTPNKKDVYIISVRECAKKDSYLNSFVDRFWNGDLIYKSSNNYFPQNAIEFYNQHKNDYVTQYSVTSPVEDIAESFADFVLQKRPLGLNMKEQKILFFYNYPELIQIRNDIRNQIKNYFVS